MNLAPIALFVYKRFELTKLTIDSLKKNPESAQSDLFIYSDAAKTDKDKDAVEQVRGYIRNVSGFKSVNIIEAETNRGLAHSIISGVTEVVNKYGRIIVLEDDMVLSPYFLRYMNNALDVYADEEEIVSVHGYVYPVREELPETFFLKGADCWGWATWKRGWEIFEPDSQKLLDELKSRRLEYEFDYNGAFNNVRMLKNQISGKVDSWAIRWHASAFLKEKLTLYPGKSLVQNIGTDELATHTKKTDIYNVKLAENPIAVEKKDPEENRHAKKQFELFFKRNNPNFISRLVKKIKSK